MTMTAKAPLSSASRINKSSHDAKKLGCETHKTRDIVRQHKAEFYAAYRQSGSVPHRFVHREIFSVYRDTLLVQDERNKAE